LCTYPDPNKPIIIDLGAMQKFAMTELLSEDSSGRVGNHLQTLEKVQ
jgi:hypothetical protein